MCRALGVLAMNVCGGSVIKRLECLPNHVSFANPRPLSVRQTDRDYVSSSLEMFYQAMNVRRRLRGRRSIVVGDQDMHLPRSRLMKRNIVTRRTTSFPMTEYERVW